MCLELIGIAGLQACVDVGNGLGGGDFVVDDLLGQAFEVNQHLHHILGDERQVLQDRQKHIQNLVGGAGIFDRESVQ